MATGSDKQTVTVTNQLTGTKSVYYGKEWLDLYRYHRDERPDIYLDLYKVEHVEENGEIKEKLSSIYVDRKWTYYSFGMTYSSCRFADMPKYDSLGYEIFYYAQEKMHINKKLFDYDEVYYKYADSTGAKPGVDDFHEIGNETGPNEEMTDQQMYLNVETGKYLLKEGGMFVNRLTGSIKVSGKKLWANVPFGFPKEELPSITITLHKFEAGEYPGDWPMLPNRIDTLTIADWSQNYENGEYKFSFKNLPKYDERGELYEYYVREQFASQMEDGVDWELVFKQPVINNYAIRNAYSPVKGSLRVRKWLDSSLYQDSNKKNPTISFKVTRSYKKSDGTFAEDTEFSVSKSVKWDLFADGMEDIVFDNLPVYAPNGTKYRYAVTENDDNKIEGGYQIQSAPGMLDKTAADSDYPYGDTVSQLILDAPLSETDTPEETWATFKNVYTAEEKAPLAFEKRWEDYQNTGGVRPKTLKFDLYRSADAQAYEGNNMSEGKVGTITIDLSTEFEQTQLLVQTGVTNLDGTEVQALVKGVTDGNAAILKAAKTWKIELQNLEVYAPNGKPWKYRLQEVNLKKPYEVMSSTKSRTFTYDANNHTFICGSNNANGYFTNTMLRNVKTWKNFRKLATDRSDNVKNLTGYKVKLQLELYVAEANPEEDGSYSKDAFFTDDSVATWTKAADSRYFKDGDQVINITESIYQKFQYSFEYDKGVRMNTKSYGINGLPSAVTVDGKSVYLQYLIMETGIELLDTSNQVVYEQTFTPHFKLCTETNGTKQIGYWIETSARVNGTTYAAEAQQLFMPVFHSEAELDKYVANPNANPLLNSNVTYKPYVPIDEPIRSGGLEITLVNTEEFTSASFTKNWVDDSNNIYGTREQNGSGWKLNFMLQQKAVEAYTGETCVDWTNYGAKRVISGTDTVNTKASSVIQDLPKKGIVKLEDGTYRIATFKYRTRECQPDGSVITENGLYNSTYDVVYADVLPTENANIYATTATNILRTIDVYAQKNWAFGTPEGSDRPVTYELQYQKPDGSWASFKTKAQVILNGIADIAKAYYEYEPWKAAWYKVPEVMPGSKTGTDGKTIYRVIETSNNSYDTANGPDGTGTDTDPYTFTNELTKLKIQKTVTRPDGAEIKDPNVTFTFEISGLNKGKTYYYETFGKNDTKLEADGEFSQFTVDANGIGRVSLKDGQYLIIRGLDKGKFYQIKETGNEYAISYQINGGSKQEGAQATVPIPQNKTEQMPSVEFINSKFGKITIHKKDQNGHPVGADQVTFQLLYREKGTTDAYKPVDTTVCKNQTITGAQGKVKSNHDGDVIFNQLMFEYDYKIVETAATDLTRLLSPIELTLPYGVDKDTVQTSGETYYTLGGKEYFAEVTIDIQDGQAFLMPKTSGNGFFWPGMMGIAAAILACAGYICVEERKQKKHKEE